MPLATVADVRALGNLPASGKLADSIVTAQLVPAARELKRWIDTYESTTDTDKATDCVEAECCICMAYLQPVLQTFYIEGITTLQRELGDLEGTHLSPDDWQNVADYWMNRAKYRMQAYIDKSTTRQRLSWHAI